MWLTSASTALAIAGAMAGALLLVALTGLPTLVAVLLGGIAGSVLATALLGSAAERADCWLEKPKV